MRSKQKVDTIIALCLILLGVLLLLLPMFCVTDIYSLNNFIFSSYTILNLIQFLFTKSSKDYEGLFSACASFVILIVNIIINPTDEPGNLAMLLLGWITLMSLIKLKKIDYYHDRNDRMWKLRVFNLCFFILTGVLMSINLAYNSGVQVIVIGFFMLIHGMLELFDPIVKTLILHS